MFTLEESMLLRRLLRIVGWSVCIVGALIAVWLVARSVGALR